MMAMLSTNTPAVLTSLEWSEFVLVIRLSCVVCYVGNTTRISRDVTIRVSVELVTWLPIFGINAQRLL